MESQAEYLETTPELRKIIEERRSHALSKNALHSLNITDTQYVSNAVLKMEFYVMDGLANKNKAAETPKVEANEAPKKEFNPFIDIEYSFLNLALIFTSRIWEQPTDYCSTSSISTRTTCLS